MSGRDGASEQRTNHRSLSAGVADPAELAQESPAIPAKTRANSARRPDLDTALRAGIASAQGGRRFVRSPSKRAR